MSKTIVGLVVIIVGWLGLAQFFSESEIGQAVDAILVLSGIITAWYGRIKAAGKINWLGKKM
jgi:hypothetical protein